VTLDEYIIWVKNGGGDEWFQEQVVSYIDVVSLYPRMS